MFTRSWRLYTPPYKSLSLSTYNNETYRHYYTCHQPYIHISIKHNHQDNYSSGEQRQDIKKKVLYQPNQTLNPTIYSGLQITCLIIRLRKKRHLVSKQPIHSLLRQVATNLY